MPITVENAMDDKIEVSRELLHDMRIDLQEFHDEVVATDEDLMDEDDCAVCRAVETIDWLLNKAEDE
jgi:hypothetical protein